MEIITSAINEAVSLLIMAGATAIAGYVGVWFKNLYERKVNTDIRRKVCADAVAFVEQVYSDLGGPEKFDKAMQAAEAWLAAKNIRVDLDDLTAMIEAAVYHIRHPELAGE